MLRQRWPAALYGGIGIGGAVPHTSVSESVEARYVVVSGHKMVVLATRAEARNFLVPVFRLPRRLLPA